jgi:hypothetical protein
VKLLSLGWFFLGLGGWLFWAALVFELKASCLLGRHSTTWGTPPALFLVDIFIVYKSRENCFISPARDFTEQTVCAIIISVWLVWFSLPSYPSPLKLHYLETNPKCHNFTYKFFSKYVFMCIVVKRHFLSLAGHFDKIRSWQLSKKLHIKLLNNRWVRYVYVIFWLTKLLLFMLHVYASFWRGVKRGKRYH